MFSLSRFCSSGFHHWLCFAGDTTRKLSQFALQLNMGSPRPDILDSKTCRSLCARCSSIDYQSIFRSSPNRTKTLEPILGLGNILKESDAACQLCRLFRLAAYDGVCLQVPNESFYLYAVDIGTISNEWPHLDKPSLDALDYPKVLAISRDPDSSSDGYPLLWSHPSNGLIRACTKNENPFPLRMVDQSQVDILWLEHWLQVCEREHEACSYVTQRNREWEITCIECVSGEAVLLPPTESYYALSYVCGSAYLAGQNGEMPQTVKDAVTMVTMLGGKYLWVDAYCINQENEQEKRDMIGRMDAIYEGAVVTLVAAAGQDATYGLPGISKDRIIQPSCEALGMVFVSSWPHLDRVLENCRWATRAWTFQEAILSRRCIFFTDYQVYLVCRETSSDECLQFSMPYRGSMDSHFLCGRRPLLEASHSLRAWKSLYGPHDLFTMIRQYKGRNLTYVGDSVQAFEGILNRSYCPSLCGVPITYPFNGSNEQPSGPDLDAGLVRGLLWYRALGGYAMMASKDMEREPSFPSWSPAGWTAHVAPLHWQAFRALDIEMDWKATWSQLPRIDTYFDIMNGDDGLVPLQEYLRVGQSKAFQHPTTKLVVTGKISGINLHESEKCWQSFTNEFSLWMQITLWRMSSRVGTMDVFGYESLSAALGHITADSNSPPLYAAS
jgi:hypothetical protein